ncbi:PqqD family protein [Priestia megaterium]|uniref:PqqD family protein n=1 Tax=Priestia megaterium TaxID=1404 RepID=UPI002079BC86|nr:PqqD family protein [Priestia megaterium]USL45842.1 PqqD family peptide modification chaperone [Priestia megaterium]
MNFQTSQNVVFTETDGEAVVLDIESGIYFGLDEVGVDIWKLIEQHGSSDKVKKNMLKMYDVQEEVLEVQLHTFLESLLEKGLITSV